MLARDTPALMPMLEKLKRRSTFTSDESDALLALPFRMVNAEPGTYLFREGDTPDNCCVLLSGSAYRHKVARSGSRQILAIHVGGDLLGLDQGLLDVTDYNVQCLSRADVGFIPYRAILDLTVAFPAIGQAFWRETFVEASVAREWIVNVGQRDAQQRIAHLICEIAVRQDVADGDDDPRLDWYLTQEQLGDATGLTPIHVNRTIQKMRSAGLIATQRHSLTILDSAALQDAGEFNRSFLHLPPQVAA